MSGWILVFLWPSIFARASVCLQTQVMENWKCSSRHVLILDLSGSEPASVLCPVTNLEYKSLQNESCLPTAPDFVSELWKVWKLYSTSFEFLTYKIISLLCVVLRLLPGFRVSGVTTTYFFFFCHVPSATSLLFSTDFWQDEVYLLW